VRLQWDVAEDQDDAMVDLDRSVAIIVQVILTGTITKITHSNQQRRTVTISSSHQRRWWWW
jgi:hypothetical protein